MTALRPFLLAGLWLAAGDVAAQPAEPDSPPAPETPPPAPAPSEPPASRAIEPATPPSAADDAAAWADEPPAFSTDVYGYIDAQFSELLFTGGLPAEEQAHIEQEKREEKPRFGLNLNLMLQGTIVQRYHWFLNLGSQRASDPGDPDVPIGVRNAWVEAPIYRELLQLRVGKTYRRFGLYNEILDAAPTFPGVEQPEFLVAGQFLLTRTTNVMLHGSWLRGEDRLVYTLHTGQDEATGSRLPVGGDARYGLGDLLLFGSSFYWSNRSAPTRAVGEGQPLGGVINWMDHDEFVVVGGYAQLTRGPLLVQVEYWRGDHDAERDPTETLILSDRAELNDRQRERLFGGERNPTVDDVNIAAEYAVQTAWSRIAYEIDLGSPGAITPYVHFEWYSHPEGIEGKELGGNEAGLADDGVFYRTVGGMVYRPVPQIALKAEVNPHLQKVDADWTIVAPFQASLSYYWKLGGE